MLHLPAMTAEGAAITIQLDQAALESLRAAVTPLAVRPMTPAEFATYAGLSLRTVSRCLSAGLPRIKIGRSVRIEPAPALEWLRGQSAASRRRRGLRLT